MPKKNNTAEVSTIKGVAGGYLFFCPVDKVKDLPADYKTPLGDEWENVGFVSEEGMTESLDTEKGDATVDMSGDTILAAKPKSYSESIKFKLVSINGESYGLQYGHANVTVDDDTMTVLHRWSKAGEDLAMVADLVLKDGRPWRKVVSSGCVTNVDDLTLSNSDVVGREVTYAYNANSDGVSCTDYIKTLAEDATQETPGTTTGGTTGTETTNNG